MDLKQLAAEYGLRYVQNGMSLGLGSGSTMNYFINLLADSLRSGNLTGIKVVPTSDDVHTKAVQSGIPITNLTENPFLDLAIDGADEVDSQLNLIKGLGKALLREKIVVTHANQFVVIVDESKLVRRLGESRPLPVEIVTFEKESQVAWLNTFSRATLWQNPDGSPVMTDNGNCLALCSFHPDGISDASRLARELADRPGIIEHGLFLGLTTRVVIASQSGVIVKERTP
jgi:ribose 5-phosphate isomerase A